MQFAVIGNPIAHSLSPILHNCAFKALGIAGFYGRYLLPQNASFYSLRSLHLQGANITIPFKETAFNSCDENFGIAKEIGAVNTIVFEGNKMFGYNTDALGFYLCIEHLNPKSALIIGAGGSAKAVACILQSKGIETTILNRSKERLESFKTFKRATFEDFKPDSGYNLIINATPSGLTNNALPLDSAILTPLLQNTLCAIDLVYGIKTPFLQLAQSLKIPHKDGKEMLINQAILSFEIWLEKIPYSKEILYQSMQEAL